MPDTLLKGIIACPICHIVVTIGKISTYEYMGTCPSCERKIIVNMGPDTKTDDSILIIMR